VQQAICIACNMRISCKKTPIGQVNRAQVSSHMLFILHAIRSRSLHLIGILFLDGAEFLRKNLLYEYVLLT
jgi:hypothetical protein